MAKDRYEFLPPKNIEAEQQVIGACLMANKAFHAVQSFLEPKYFSEPIHQEIWRVASEMIEAGNAATPITVKTYLPDQKIGEMSLAQYMLRLVEEALPPSMVVDTAREIVRLWLFRSCMDICNDTIARCAKPEITDTASRILDQATSDMGKLQAIADRNHASSAITLKQAMAESIDATALAYKRERVAGYDTGLDFINDLTGPWLPGQYIIIGAATKIGKSSLAMQCALGIATQAPVLYYSFEMNAALLAGRILASKTKIGTLRQRRGDIQTHEFDKLVAASEAVNGSENLHIRSRRLAIEQIMEDARRFKREHGVLGAVVVDHLGILSGKGSDWELAAHASPIMKEMAEELDCVAIGLSQVLKENPAFGISRKTEAETMKAKIAASIVKPHAGMLKGPAGNDADHLIMPFRAEAMIDRIEPAEGTEARMIWEDAKRDHKDKAQIVLALSRESKWPRVIDVSWNGPATEFQSATRDEPTFGGL